MKALFIATEKCDPDDGSGWTKYCEWAKIPQLKEVVSLDGILCPHLVRDFIDEDWQHNVQENYRLNYFYDLNYLLGRISGVKRRNVLGLYRNPETHISEPPGAGDFKFAGYDLIDEETQISALTNCGGFPLAFSNDELSCYGLISDYTHACRIRERLINQYPNDPHADCELYAIWRLKETELSC